MQNEMRPVEGADASVNAEGVRVGGALWIIAGVICAGLLIFVFVGENLVAQNSGLSAMVLSGAVVALLIGGLLLVRPGPGVVLLSTVVGVAWLLAFGTVMLMALNGPDRGPTLSSGLITGFGVAGALVTFRAGRSGRRPA